MLALGGFRVRDRNELPVKVDVFPDLVRISPRRIPVSSAAMTMGRRCFKAGGEEFHFLGHAHHGTARPALANHSYAGDGIHLEEAFVDGPIEDVTNDFDVPVDGRFRKRLAGFRVGPPVFLVAEFAVTCDVVLRDPSDRHLGEPCEELLRVSLVVCLHVSFGEESRPKFGERHIRAELRELEALRVELILPAVFEDFCLTAVGGPQRADVTHAVDPDHRRVPSPALVETHFTLLSFGVRESTG